MCSNDNLLGDLIHCGRVAVPHDCNFDTALAIQIRLVDDYIYHFGRMSNPVVKHLVNYRAVYLTDEFDDTLALWMKQKFNIVLVGLN